MEHSIVDIPTKKSKIEPPSVWEIRDNLLRIRKYWTDTKNKSRLFAWNEDHYDNNGENILRMDLNKILIGTFNISHVNNIIEAVKIKTMKPFKFLPKNMIPLKNGIFVFSRKNNCLITHIPSVFYTSTLDINYDPNATCPNFDHLLIDLGLNNDDITFIYELIGYCMYRDVPIPLLPIWVGGTHSGKSTLEDIFIKILGADNCSSVSLSALIDNRFATSGLVDKLVNISSETEEFVKALNLIKQISSGDTITIEFKGQTAFTYRPTLKMINICNRLPTLRDYHDSGIFGRVRIVQFLKSFDGSTPKNLIINQCTTPDELSGIFNKAMVGLRNVLSKGKFNGQLNVEDSRNKYYAIKHTYQQFINNEIKLDPNSFVLYKEIYYWYLRWCREYGYPIELSKSTELTKKINDSYSSDVVKIKHTKDGDGWTCTHFAVNFNKTLCLHP